MIAFTNRGDEMIREDIMERLVCFSDEEINNLNGFVAVSYTHLDVYKRQMIV